MEALFPLLIVVIAVVGSIVSAASKERTQKENQRQMKAFQAAQNQPQAPKPQNQTGRTMSQPSAAAAVPLQPTVHAHTTPECPTHDNYGSLDYASTEGKDPCHEAQLSHDGTPGEEPEAQPSLALEWTGENLVKAVVMQEILTRPCQRRAR